MIPPPLAALALALAAFRCYRLLAHDTILARPRAWLIGPHYHGARSTTFDRPRLADWLVCAWCCGAWCSLAWYGAWLLWPRGSLYAAAPLAISAAVAIAQAALPD